MRQQQKSNRSRGRGNRNKGGGGGNNLNRVFDSAGPEGKVRGTPQQIIDKYLMLARDAQTSGDRVAAENFLQHAEHYQRILIAATSEQEKARREAQAQATEDQSDEQPDVLEVADPQGQQNNQNNGNGNGNGNGRDQNRRRKPPSNDIGGMTTIDAGEQPESLVVATEETPQPQVDGQQRRSRRRPQKREMAAPEAAAPSPAPAGDTPSETTEPAGS